MPVCECGSDDLELITTLLVTEIDAANVYSEGIYLCKFCLGIVRVDGVTVDPEDVNLLTVTINGTERFDKSPVDVEKMVVACYKCKVPYTLERKGRIHNGGTWKPGCNHQEGVSILIKGEVIEDGYRSPFAGSDSTIKQRT